MMDSSVYDKKTLVGSLAVLALTVALIRGIGGFGFLLIVPFVILALATRRSDKLFFYILLITTMLVANGKVVPKDMVFGISQRGLMLVLGFCMAMQVFGSKISPLVKPFLWIFPYVFFMIIPSCSGWNPYISFLKLFLFAVIYMAYFGVANQAAQNPRLVSGKVRSVILSVAIFFIVGSICLLPFPAISQLTGEEYLNNPNATSLFMGMTSQSQALGPAISALAVILLGDLLFSVRRMDKLYLALLLCCPYLIYKTSSRTGMGSFLFGLGYVVFLFVRAKGIGSKWRGWVMSKIGILIVTMIVAGAMVPGIRQGAVNFILKSTGADKRDLSAEKIIASRQGKIDESREYFYEKPLCGNGFQVIESMSNIRAGSLILSAPMEKGVWVYAVLEEGGIIGFTFFAGFLFFAITGLARRRAYIGSSCLFVCMLTNLGEFTFFSMTYMGGFVWAMVFAGVALDAQRLRQEERMGLVRGVW